MSAFCVAVARALTSPVPPTKSSPSKPHVLTLAARALSESTTSQGRSRSHRMSSRKIVH